MEQYNLCQSGHYISFYRIIQSPISVHLLDDLYEVYAALYSTRSAFILSGTVSLIQLSCWIFSPIEVKVSLSYPVMV